MSRTELFASPIPASAPAAVLWFGTDMNAAPVDIQIEQTDPPGLSFTVRPDPRMPTAFWLTPATPLDAYSSRSVSISFACSNAKEGLNFGRDERVTRTVHIATAAASPFPAHVGQFSMPRDEFDRRLIIIKPSPELAPFAGTTLYELRVDGRTSLYLPYGFGLPDGEGTTSDGFLEIFASYLKSPTPNPPLCSSARSRLGTIELHAHIAGADVEPEPAVLEKVEIDCSWGHGGGEMYGQPIEGAEPSESTDGGCSVVSSSASVGARYALVWLAIFVGMGALARRARRANSV